MNSKARIKLRHVLLTVALLATVHPVAMAQTTSTMVNNDTVFIDGCELGSGVIYDDGGATSNYSNNFNGWVVITTNPGVTVTVTGNYNTESSYSDYFSIWDDNTLMYDHLGGYGSMAFSSTSGNLVLRFRSDGSSNYSGFAINWSVNGAGTTCSNAVSALTASNVSSTSMDLVWTADAAAGPFTVEYNGLQVSGITTSSYTLTNLNPNTRYVVSVMATADTAHRCCADHVAVRTDCGSSGFPFSEGFEGFAEDSFPSCWLLQKNFDVIEYNPRIDAAHSSSGYRSLMLSCGGNETPEHFGMVATPCFAGTGDRVLHFKMRASHYNTQVIVGVCDSIGTENNNYGFIPITTLNIDNQWADYRVNWTATTSGQRLAFRMLQSQQYGTGRMIYLDDIEVESCGIDSVRATQIDFDRLTLVWSAFGNPNCTVTVRRLGAASDTLTFSNATSPLLITGLQAEHTYQIFVQPYCGTQPAFGRGTTATTSSMPVSAVNYCSTLFSGNTMPNNNILIVTERLLNLAGKRVVVEYSTNETPINVGTLQYADDMSTFVALGIVSSTTSGDRVTAVYDVPATSNGRYLGIVAYYNYTYRIEIGNASCLTGHHKLVHRRGTKVQLDWGTVYDTVLVQYGVNGFSVGSGQIDTFYNSRRGTVEGLTTSTYYDFYIYRPCGQPCPARILTTRTATADYPLPYCENFNNLYDNMWTYGSNSWYGNGDWRMHQSVNSVPRFASYPYDYVAGRMLEMASWGFPNQYYSMAGLPDVEVDNSTIMSFYISGTYPDAKLVVGVLPERFYGYGEFIALDTITLGNGAYRTHYNYQLPASTTLFDRRLALMFYHTHEYEFYRAYIDELQLAHASYAEVKVLAVGSDTVTLKLTGLMGTDSATVTLSGGGNNYMKAIGAADTAAFGFGGLQPGTRYNVYVQPYDGGCNSYATHFFTLVNGDMSGDSYANCFPMTDVLSYELPRHWATTDTHYVNPNDELELPAGSALVMNPSSYQNGYTLVLHAKSSMANDTLVIGAYAPSDTVSTDSTHFTFDPTLFTPVDTLLLTTGNQPYSLQLPSLGTGSRRLCFVTGQGTAALSDIGIHSCSFVHFEPDGDGLVCTTPGISSPLYFLTIDDSASSMHRELRIDESPFTVIGLAMNKTYYLSVRCPYGGEECTQDTVIHMGNQLSLPYCEYFDQQYTNITLPATWKVIKTNSSQTVQSSENHITFNPNNQWLYVVLPEFTVDSALSVYADFESNNSNGVVQIGVMNDDHTTSSFIPVYSLEKVGTNSWQRTTAEVDLGAHVGKRVVLRFKTTTYLYSIRVYGLPIVKYELIQAHTLRLSTATNHPYWLHWRNISGQHDEVIYIDQNPYIFHPNITLGNSNTIRVAQVIDSTGYTCENMRILNIQSAFDLPFCRFGGFDGITYFNNVYNTCSPATLDNSAQTFYGGAWFVYPEFNIDSIQHVYLALDYIANTPDDSLVIGVMTDAYDTLTFVPVDTLTYTLNHTTLQQAIIDFSSYADTGRWVTMHYLNRNNNSHFFVCNTLAGTCIGAIGATATLYRWNRVKIDAPAVPFYVEYFPVTSTSAQGNAGNSVLRIDSVPTILTLNPDTKYDFYFHCDSTGLSCRQNQRVKTLAAPLYVPGCVDFDTCTVGEMPGSNWERRNNTIAVTNLQSHSGNRSLAIPIASNAYVITPDADIDSLQHVAMSIWYYTEDPADRLVVGVMSNPNDLNTYHPIRTLAPGTAGTWQRGLVEFSSAPEDAFFIVLHARSNHLSDGRSIYVDDIYLDTSIAFDLRVAEISSNSLTLNWKHMGNPDVTVTVMDGDQVVSTFTQVVPPLLIEPLSILHYYTFLFSSQCGPITGYCNTNYLDTLSLITPAPGVGCVNATDLNSPQAVFFSGTYDNPYDEAGAINYGSLHPDSRHTICYDTAQRDPRTGGQLRTIPEGYTSSVRLGNWSTNYFTPEAEGVIYSLFVDTASFELLLLRYAAVLQDPNHATADQPRFRMELLDTNYNIIDSACTSADFIANQNLGWHSANDGVLWKDWTSVGIDLSSHAGQQVYFRLTTYDCNEGLHYGYAYFTLECMRKNMNTVSCGDVDSNTLSAPEGFHYRWYTSQSNATVSTEQNITVASEDITYYCDVSKIDNDHCRFTISAYVGTRYPMADFDTTVVLDSCIYYVTFTNTGGVSNDGVNMIPGERCETAYWDFGNGTTSTSYHGHAVYPQPGVYTVRLISGIGMDACQDTMEMVLDLRIPFEMMPADTTLASICDNQHYFFHNQFYAEEGTHLHLVPIENSTCDSLYVLMLDVRPTTHGDTVAVVCDSLLWRGTLYDTTGVYTSNVVGLNSVGCDSTRVLQLTVNYSQETNDDRIICPGYPFLYLGVDYGAPTAFDMMFRTRANCDSLVHVTLMARDSNYHLMTLFRFDSTEWQVPDSMLRSCDPTTLDLLDTTQGAAAWNWALFMADTQATSIDSTVTYRFEQGQKQLLAYINLIVTDTLGCYDTVGWPVFVFPSSIPEFRWEPEVPALHNPETQFINLTQPDTVTYLWHIQQVEGGEFDTTSVAAPFYHWGEPDQNMAGEYEVRLDAMWQHFVDPFRLDSILWIDSTLRTTYLYKGFSHTCIDSVTHTVVITNDFLQFPNLVTPNGDGVNDTWVIVNLLEFGNYSMNELWIYDRTGAQVYHVRDIRRPEQFWDPKATRSPDGTYYYRFMAKGEYGLVKRNGLIEVIH